MRNSLEIKELVLAELKTLPICKPNSNLRNWTVRCPYCGDSVKSDHGHFSILIDLQSDAPMLYRCFRCNESGILTPQVLEDLNLGYSESLAKDLNMMNKRVSKNSYFSNSIKNFIVPYPLDNPKNAYKLSYINNRLGTQINFRDCSDFKIILSFKEFLKVNDIPIGIPDANGWMLKQGVVHELDNNYIGFLSSNNNKIVFRDITNNGSGFFKRYYKVTLDALNRSPNTFYSLMSKFNPLYTNSINVYVAEGPFDILSVYLNLQPETSQNTLFFASCGYSFSTILKYLIYQGVNTDINLHVYSDNDKTDESHSRLLGKALYKIWVDNIYIHRNIYKGEKDFGVSKDRIIDNSYKLKI